MSSPPTSITSTNLSIDAFVATVTMEQRGELSATQAKTVLGELLANGGDPRAIAADKGYEQLSADTPRRHRRLAHRGKSRRVAALP